LLAVPVLRAGHIEVVAVDESLHVKRSTITIFSPTCVCGARCHFRRQTCQQQGRRNPKLFGPVQNPRHAVWAVGGVVPLAAIPGGRESL
jgi:hypothetical protein